MRNSQRIGMFHLILMAIALFVFFLTFAGVTNTAYANIWMLPLSMFIVLCISGPILKKSKGVMSFQIFMGIEYLRYIIIPFFMVANNFYDSTYYASAQDGSAKIAIYLMCYELVFEVLCMYFAVASVVHSKKRGYQDRDEKPKTTLLFLISLLLIVFTILYCYVNSLTIRINLFMFSLPSTNRIFVGGENYLQCASALLFFCFGLPMLRKMEKNQKFDFKFLILAFFWIGIGFGNVRMMYVIKAITVVYLVTLFLPLRISKKIGYGVIGVAMFIIMAMTLLDDNASHGLFFFTGSSLERSTYAYTLQKYFGGPYNVAKAIEVAHDEGFGGLWLGVKQLWTDMAGNVYPFYNYSSMDTTKILFNYHLYGSYEKATQIIPIVGQGYIYFGFLFAFLPTILLMILLTRIEVKKNQIGIGNSVKSMFLTYASVYLAFMKMYNVTIITGFMVNVVLYGLIFCTMQDKLKIVK